MDNFGNSSLRRARYLEEDKKVKALIEWAEFYKGNGQYEKAKLTQIQIEHAKKIRDHFKGPGRNNSKPGNNDRGSDRKDKTDRQ